MSDNLKEWNMYCDASTDSCQHYYAVEVVGGPSDGLRFVKGIADFGQASPDKEQLLFSVDASGAKYVRRALVEDGVLYLDVCEESLPWGRRT